MEASQEAWRTARRIITLTAIVAGVYLWIVNPIGRAVSNAQSGAERSLKEILDSITQTDTHVVEGRAEVRSSVQVAELALLDLRMSASRSIEKTEAFSGLPLGTKKLVVRGHYRVKAGYKLTPGISLTMAEQQAIARFPKASVLSIELIDYDVLSEDSGWLNRVQPADRAQILRELREQMRDEVNQSGILQTVDANLQTRLSDLFGGKPIKIEPLEK